MKQSKIKAYETQFEMAKRLGKTPASVRKLALQFQIGPFGSSGGVLFFPTDGKDMAFFSTIMRARYLTKRRR